LGVALAIVPFATIPFDRNLEGKGLLTGKWRLQETNDPRDQNWFDRLFRWFLNRPLLLAAVLILVVIAIFVTLLTIGPPGGKQESA
jgi:uncharacterized membrane protein YdfJ with MMPL/SSD domain